MKNRKSVRICRIVLGLAAVMNIVDLFVKPGYFVKSVVKIIMFAGLPGVYFILNPIDRLKMKKLFHIDKSKLKLPLCLGMFCCAVIVAGYSLGAKWLDLSAVTGRLGADMGVTKENFLFVSLYICLCNSLLEEFLFRGFGFMILKNHTGRNFACIFSRMAFAFYHIGMTAGWVNIYLYILGFVGLVAGGVIFNILDENTGSIYSSWIVHMFINFGINTVGFMLFGMI